MKHYTIEYYENGCYEDVKKAYVLAASKEDAYLKFMESNGSVYGAWVARVTYNNGNVKEFNTFCGKPV